MSTHTVLQYSPAKTRLSPALRRSIRPSPEKKCLPNTTVILPRERVPSTTETGSPVKKRPGQTGDRSILESQFDIQLDKPSFDLEEALKSSKRIDVGFSLIKNGRFVGPPQGQFDVLGTLFPTTFIVEVHPPFLIIRVKTLPPRPWPFTVAGMPLHLTTHETDPYFNLGAAGRGLKALQKFTLQRDEFSEEILKEAIAVFRDLNVTIHDIAWFGSFWQITVADGTDLKAVPCFIASHACFYKFKSETAENDPPSLRAKIPEGVEYDDSFYGQEPDALLRPGVMVSSSSFSVVEDGKTIDRYRSTTSGIMIVNQYGKKFITVATHGFENDGLVWHPTPNKGKVIGRIIDSLPGTDISIAELNPGIRYVNETFGNTENRSGLCMSGISPNYPPHIYIGDTVTMDNPFSGFCEGQIMALGAKIPGHGDIDFIPHRWMVFENGNEPIAGSCGSAILDAQRRVVAIFRFKKNDSGLCYGVSAIELRTFGYEICDGEQIF